jgi:hypothetical protein
MQEMLNNSARRCIAKATHMEIEARLGSGSTVFFYNKGAIVIAAPVLVMLFFAAKEVLPSLAAGHLPNGIVLLAAIFCALWLGNIRFPFFLMSKPAVLLTDEGISFGHLGHTAIPWSSVTGIHVERVFSHVLFVRVETSNDRAFLPPLTSLRGLFARLPGLTGFASIGIESYLVAGAEEKLVAAINRHWAQATSEPSSRR